MTPRMLRPLSVALVAALALAACGDDEATSIARDDLEALLPSAADIGADYEIAADDDDDADDDDAPNPVDAAMEEACPAAAALRGDDTDTDDLVERDYETDDGRTVTVKLNPSPRNLADDELDPAIEAINSCDTIEVAVDDFAYTVTMSAERDDDLGDRGVRLVADMEISHPQLPAPLQMQFTALNYVVDDRVSVGVSASDGIDEATASRVPADIEVIDRVATELEPEVVDLVG